MIGKSLVFPFVFHQGRLKNGATSRSTVGGGGGEGIEQRRKVEQMYSGAFRFLMYQLPYLY